MMNRRSLIALIRSKSINDLTSAYTQSDLTQFYLSIFERPYDSASIGITDEGYWCVVHRNTIYSLKESKDADVFLLLLYTPLQEIVSLLKSGLQSYGLPIEILLTFPFDEILIHAFSSKWQLKAITWLDEGYPMNDEMRNLLWGGNKQAKTWLRYQESRLFFLQTL